MYRIYCPKCNTETLNTRGKYSISRTQIAQRRFMCKKCNYNFTERTGEHRKKIITWKRIQVLRLYRKQKDYVNKYDNKKSETYSTREIAKILKVSKTFVWDIIKNEKSK